MFVGNSDMHGELIITNYICDMAEAKRLVYCKTNAERCSPKSEFAFINDIDAINAYRDKVIDVNPRGNRHILTAAYRFAKHASTNRLPILVAVYMMNRSTTLFSTVHPYDAKSLVYYKKKRGDECGKKEPDKISWENVNPAATVDVNSFISNVEIAKAIQPVRKKKSPWTSDFAAPADPASNVEIAKASQPAQKKRSLWTSEKLVYYKKKRDDERGKRDCSYVDGVVVKGPSDLVAPADPASDAENSEAIQEEVYISPSRPLKAFPYSAKPSYFRKQAPPRSKATEKNLA